jgi:hypothetical protein
VRGNRRQLEEKEKERRDAKRKEIPGHGAQ